MTDKKLCDLFALYLLETKRLEATRMSGNTRRAYVQQDVVLHHINWMCVEAMVFVADGRREKAMRWLGFIQGVMFSEGIFTINELANHSRPDGSVYEEDKGVTK